MSIHTQDVDFVLHCGDALETLRELPNASVHCCVTSPPYLNARPEYGTLTHRQWRDFFWETRRVVTGPMLLNVGRLWRDGCESDWWMRLLRIADAACWDHLDTLIWIKPNANPIHGAVLANSHEYVLILGDATDHRLNVDAIRTEYDPETILRFQRRYINGTGVKGEVRNEDGRDANPAGARPRSFYIGYTGRDKGNDHPAPMAADLAAHLVSLASWPGQTVLDPFAGSGTTNLVARNLGRRSIGIELNPQYCELAAQRLAQQSLLAEPAA